MFSSFRAFSDVDINTTQFTSLGGGVKMYPWKMLAYIGIALTLTIFAIKDFSSPGNLSGKIIKQQQVHGGLIMTDRGPSSFNVQHRKGGETYERKMTLHLVTSVPNLGKSNFKKYFDMTMEATEKVTDLLGSGGKQEVDTTFTHFTRKEGSITGLKRKEMSCDTAIAFKTALVPCTDLYNLLGKKKHSIDSQGVIDIANTTDTGNDAANDPLNKVKKQLDLGTKQLQQISRLLKLIPSNIEVRPGDMWDASNDMGDSGRLTAQGKLLGYINYNGFDCAVIDIEGTLAMEVQHVMNTLGGNVAKGSIANHLTVPDDATLHATLYYDYEHMLIRWSNTTMNMVMSMLQKNGYPAMIMPVTEIMESSSRRVGDPIVS